MVAILYFSVAVLVVATTLFGWNLAELNAPQKAIQRDLGLDATQIGLAASILAIGGFIGSIISTPCMNAVGRKKVLFFNALGFALSGAVKGTAKNFIVFTFGRFLGGVCSGTAAVIVPIYLNELAPPNLKGSYGALTQASINAGILASQVLGIFLGKDGKWRYILFAGGIVGLAQAVLLRFLPESPMSLVAAGKLEQARKELSRLRGTGDVEDELATYMGNSTVAEGEDEDEETRPLLVNEPEKIGLWEFVLKGSYRKELIVVTGVMLAQQLLGINSVVFYGVSILHDLLPKSATYVNAGISLVNLSVTLAASTLFDRVPHKTLLISSMALMTMFSLLLSLGIHYGVPILSALATLFFVASFSIGLGPLPWMVASRRIEPAAVSAAQSIGLTANWMGTFAVSFVVPVLAQAAGMDAVFLVFSSIGLFFVCWGALYL